MGKRYLGFKSILIASIFTILSVPSYAIPVVVDINPGPAAPLYDEDFEGGSGAFSTYWATSQIGGGSVTLANEGAGPLGAVDPNGHSAELTSLQEATQSAGVLHQQTTLVGGDTYQLQYSYLNTMASTADLIVGDNFVGTFSQTPLTVVDSNFVTTTVDFVANIPNNDIFFTINNEFNANAAAGQVFIDNVSFTDLTAAPEINPGSATLPIAFAFGILMLFSGRRKRSGI